MTDDQQPTAQVDTATPSIARTYDASLGGKDNFEVDREVMRQVLEVVPEFGDIAMGNRRWLIRAVRFLTEQAGIDQFLDLGSGLPTAENTHQAAQRINPDARVVYVDNDSACQAFGRALLEENHRTHFADADLTYPAEVLNNPQVTKHVDFSRPVGLMHCATLHHVADEQYPREIMEAYREALPSGSYLVLSHACDPQDAEGYYTRLARSLEQRFWDAGFGSGYLRTPDEIRAFFGDWELIDPGLVILPHWWPDGPRVQPLTDGEHLMVGGVARKP